MGSSVSIPKTLKSNDTNNDLNIVVNFLQFKTSSNSTMMDISNTSVNMWRNLLLNNYVIGGASMISSSGTLNAIDNITTTAGNIVATTGNITASNGTITGKTGSFDTLAITRISTWKPLTSTSRGVYIGLDSVATGGIEIITDTG